MNSNTAKIKKKRSTTQGDIIYVGKNKNHLLKINILEFGSNIYNEQIEDENFNIPIFPEDNNKRWINIDGVHNTEILGMIGDQINLHPVVLDAIANTLQRTNVTEHDDYIYAVLKNPQIMDNQTLSIEQISIIITKNMLITFQEDMVDNFSHIREKIKSKYSRIRSENIDYLAYSIIDTIVDNYYTIVEFYNNKVEKLEESLFEENEKSILRQIQETKKEILYLNNLLFPLREVVLRLRKSENPIISQQVSIFFTDVYDHVIQLLDNVNLLRDTANVIMDTYISNSSNRLNEIMKILTIISTIFIPLTFIVGIYGMNFDYMPELRSVFGYPMVLLFMVSLSLVMMVYFKRKKWF